MPDKLLIGRRVLICEDEAVAAMALTRAASFMGSTSIHTCASGEAAVECALQHRPDLVLMDVQMDGIGGIEAVRQIKERMDPCVIMISGSTTDVIRKAALEAGANGFLDKPVTVPEIIDAVVRYCGFRRAQLPN